jgi:hypothetical protein
VAERISVGVSSIEPAPDGVQDWLRIPLPRLHISSDQCGWPGKKACVCLAGQPSVSECQKQDHRGGNKCRCLEHDEYGVAAMHGESTDENAADEPHRPRAAADSCRAVLAPEMHHLGYVGRH